MAGELQRLEVPVHRLELPDEIPDLLRPWWRFVGLVQLRSFLAGLRPDLVHAVGFRAGLLGRPRLRPGRRLVSGLADVARAPVRPFTMLRRPDERASRRSRSE